MTDLKQVRALAGEPSQSRLIGARVIVLALVWFVFTDTNQGNHILCWTDKYPHILSQFSPPFCQNMSLKLLVNICRGTISNCQTANLFHKIHEFEMCCMLSLLRASRPAVG